MRSSRLRVLVVFGTRPEAIKLAPVMTALQAGSDQFITRTCSTGQHREMLNQVLNVFGIVPDLDLNLMTQNQTLSELGARVMQAMDEVLIAEQPDWVLVQGDTTTVMMAALAAQHRQVKVGHVEAGLRTYDRRNPFPEEMNRVVTDHVSSLCFAPTETARNALLTEGIEDQCIIVTGNTVIDALMRVADEQWAPSSTEDPLTKLPGDRDWILVTAHRRENHGAPLTDICAGLLRLATNHDGRLHIIYPVHRNPNIWEPVNAMLGGHPAITLLPPVDYRSLIYLMRHSKLILTDSGGIQEEAPSLNKPVLVLRATTERPEAVAAGATKLIGTKPADIYAATIHLLEDDAAYKAMATAINPYGDGHAAERIVAAIAEYP